MVLISMIILGSIGVIFAIALGLANKVFYVYEDPKVAEIESALSGANCGACGYPGCSAYAKAVVQTGQIDKCTPGGEETIKNLATIMKLKASSKKVKIIAHLLCGGDNEMAKRRSEYVGPRTCLEVKIVAGGDKSCSYGCFGYGDCERVCLFDAIHIAENGLPVVDKKKCTGCGVCVRECPQKILILQPADKEVMIRCVNKDKGADVMKQCTVGCIGCGMCEKNCPIDNAITMKNNLAVMNYENCVDCGLCAVVCPKNTITDTRAEQRRIPFINDKCTGCTLCARNCPVLAIEGEIKKLHKIKEDMCIGCLKCYDVCKFYAIDLKTERPKKIEYYKDKIFNREKKETVPR